MAAVNAGEIEAGVIYHYYWYQDQAEAGQNSKNTKLHFFGKQTRAAFVSVSGAGVLASSKNPSRRPAARGVPDRQDRPEVLAASEALEYPIARGVTRPTAPASRSPSSDAPDVDPGTLNSKQVVTMMQDAGII